MKRQLSPGSLLTSKLTCNLEAYFFSTYIFHFPRGSCDLAMVLHVPATLTLREKARKKLQQS